MPPGTRILPATPRREGRARLSAQQVNKPGGASLAPAAVSIDVQPLLEAGRTSGSVTYDAVNDVLLAQAEAPDADQLEDILDLLAEAGIQVISNEALTPKPIVLTQDSPAAQLAISVVAAPPLSFKTLPPLDGAAYSIESEVGIDGNVGRGRAFGIRVLSAPPRRCSFNGVYRLLARYRSSLSRSRRAGSRPQSFQHPPRRTRKWLPWKARRSRIRCGCGCARSAAPTCSPWLRRFVSPSASS